MSAGVAEEIMVCAELWLSFGSLVRAYAAASESAIPAVHVESANDVIRVTAAAARLEMRCDLETGAGDWQLSFADNTQRHGHLQLLHEGRIAMDGNTLDLDHAAIDLVALVMSAAANSARDAR